jgi:hypothetical protein
MDIWVLLAVIADELLTYPAATEVEAAVLFASDLV